MQDIKENETKIYPNEILKEGVTSNNSKPTYGIPPFTTGEGNPSNGDSYSEVSSTDLDK